MARSQMGIGAVRAALAGTLALALAFGWAVPAAAQQADDERLRQLEDEVRSLREELRTIHEEHQAAEPAAPAGEAVAPAPAPGAPAAAGPLDEVIHQVTGPQAQWFHVGGEIRVRDELRNDFDLNEDAHDTDNMVLLRTRLYVEAQIAAWLDALVELQDSRQFGEEGGTATSLDNVDLSRAYIELRHPGPENPVYRFRLGRQALLFGDERLVGAFEWSNQARRFDAATFVYEREHVRLTAFTSFVRDTGAGFNDEETFSGIYLTGKACVPGIDEADLYYFFLKDLDRTRYTGEDGDPGTYTLHTFGLRVVGKPALFEYGVEGAIQFGDRATDDVLAFMALGRAGVHFEAGLPLRLVLGTAWASGDEDPTDGDRGTFDNLFPTNHFYYGYMDLFGLQNIWNLQGTFEVKPLESLRIALDYHFFRLDRRKDAWYRAALTVVRRDLSGSASQTVGHEIDLTAWWTVSPQLSFILGYGHFFAGPFADDTGEADDADFGYAQILLKF